jgi:ABC-type polysaccharide/polyol phosphate transport system ATPase subunit
MKPAIIFDHVSKQYYKGGKYLPSLREWLGNLTTGKAFQREVFEALHDLSFTIGKGQVVGFVGSNGAGKSTILKLISKISYPTKGTITNHGNIAGLLELGAGFHPELSGKENLYLYASILGLKRKQIDKIYDNVLEFSGISEFIDMPLKHYSSGMMARLGFSVSIHIEPEILLIDEVLAVGDLAFQEKCMNFMKSYCRDPRHTVVFISHDPKNVLSICDRVIWLEHGKIVKDGTAEKVMKEYIDFQKKRND